MEFHQCRYFESVARLGSMVAAAAECHVSQPALSVQIRKLEDEAGAPLLIRESRGVRLTPAGERTLVTARRILRETAGWRSDMGSGEFTSARPVRVAAQPFIASELMPKALAGMLVAGARHRLRFQERAPAMIPSILRAGEADIALMDLNNAPARGFESCAILELTYALFVPKSSPLATASPGTLAEAFAENFLLYALAPGLPDALIASGREPAFSGENASALFELVSAGAGVAVLPTHYARHRNPSGVVMRPLADYDARLRVGWLWRTAEELPAAAITLAERLRTAYPEWAV